jgi:hypothetical protein
MAYGDYGGYAYRNGKRIESRSDATISPEGDIFGSPGVYPGIAAYITGGQPEVEKRQDWPRGHAVLGDGPIYVTLYKQSDISIYRGMERLDETEFLKDMPEASVFEIDGWRLEVFFREEDNYYQYAKLTQPDGNLWHGWSGYGVGAGLEDCGYGFSTKEREDMLKALWPESITD